MTEGLTVAVAVRVALNWPVAVAVRVPVAVFVKLVVSAAHDRHTAWSM